MVDPNGLSSEVPAALVQQLTAAGVPEAAPSELWFHPSQRVNNAGALLLFVSLVVVILGPRPRRGTRWFWFWLVGGPVSVGIAVFAVAELLRPRYEPEGTVHPRGVAGRWSGLAGFALGVVLSWRAAAVLHRPHRPVADLVPAQLNRHVRMPPARRPGRAASVIRG